MNTESAKQASDRSILLSEIFDSTIPKTEREHIAAAEIQRLNQMLRETGYSQGQIDAYAAQCEEIDRLREKIKLQNKDWCDDDEAITQQALRVLPKEAVDGDSFHVPRMGELAEMMANEIIRLRDNIKQIHKDYGCEIQDPSGTIWDHAAYLQNQVAEKDKEINRLSKLYVLSIKKVSP